jgi:putative membrane protein
MARGSSFAGRVVRLRSRADGTHAHASLSSTDLPTFVPSSSRPLPSVTPPAADRRLVGRTRGLIWLAGGAGLLLAAGLMVRSGIPDILRLLDIAGWRLLWVVPLRLVPLTLDATGWRRLLDGIRAPPRRYFAWAAVVREAVSSLLPVARVGGEVVGVRLLTRRGVPPTIAGASVVVELSVTLVVQLIFAATGLVLLVAYPAAAPVGRLAAVGLIGSAGAVAAFVFVQHRWGLFRLLERVLVAVAGRTVLATVGDPARLDGAIRALYGNRRAVVACAGWQLAGLFAGALELWVALRLLGHPGEVRQVIVVESLTMAVQSAMFIVPGGLGTQEGGFVLFGAAVGLPPQVSLALSLARRVRQVGLGLPALASWYWTERHIGGREGDVEGASPAAAWWS